MSTSRSREARSPDKAVSQLPIRGKALITQPASEISPVAIPWSWNGWLAGGRFHLLGGAPGTGKTTIALQLAALLSIGGKWPDGTAANPRSTLFWSGEDNSEDTVVPRLIAAGADLTKIHLITRTREHGVERAFDPGHDMAALLPAAQAIGDIGLIILDPVVQAVTGDSHKSADVRRALQPLVDLSCRTGAAILGITHFSKGTAGADPVERITGSVAFGALARVVLVAAKEPGSDSGRILARAKSNIGPDGGGFAYSVQTVALESDPHIVTSRICWGEEREGSAAELLGGQSVGSPSSAAFGEAGSWLRNELQEGPQLCAELYARGEALGYGRNVLSRAMKREMIRRARDAFGPGSRVYWYLPEHADRVRAIKGSGLLPVQEEAGEPMEPV